MSVPGDYPPAHHALRDLPFEVEVVSELVHRGHLDPAAWSVGAMATVVDVLCGSLCAAVVAPDWMATSSLTLRTAGLPATAPIVLDARVVRAGRRSVTIEVAGATAGSAAPVLDAVLSFSRLERRESNLDLSGRSVEPGTRFRFGDADRRAEGSDAAFDTTVGQVVLDAEAGVTETPVTPYVRNSFGAVNGGVVAALAAGAGAAAVGVTAAQVDEISVHHLGQGREGPVRTAAQVLPGATGDPGRRVVRVELRDVSEDRLVALARVGVTLPSGRV